MQILQTDLHIFLIKLMERFVIWPKYFLFSDHFVYSHNLFFWVSINVSKRNSGSLYVSRETAHLPLP